ncbi:MAG TPA: hypothetical protein VGK48_07670 [Terriglobia bacterium]|jgi:hypothetical protein
MMKLVLALLSMATVAGNGVDYKADPNWLKLQEGRTEIGSMHGTVAVSSANEVYINVEGTVRQRFAVLGPNPGLQVYSADGKYLRNVPNAPFDLHGFVIRKEPDGEYIYASRLAAGLTAEDQKRAGLDKEAVIKMTLDGKMVMTIPPSAIPDQFKNKAPDGRPVMRLTSVAVAPNGDIYATDGYASDYIHRFDKNGKYIQSFGGKMAPYSFRTMHQLTIDTRYTPARLLACDRANNRLVHLSLNGDFIGVVATGLLAPAAVAVRGDYVAVAELRGRVTLLDKNNAIAATLSSNTTADEIGRNTTDPAKWKPGIANAPHGITFDAQGNIYVAEFSLFGRLHKFNLAS